MKPAAPVTRTDCDLRSGAVIICGCSPNRGCSLVLQDRHSPRPTGGGGFDLDGEAGNREAVRWQRLQVVQLLDVAVANLAASPVAFPDELGVLGGSIPLGRVREGRIPGPGVGAGDLDAPGGQIERGLPAHAAAAWHVVRRAVASPRRRVDEDDVERPQRMAETLQFGLDVGRSGNIPVGEMAEVELDAGLEAPLQGHLVDAQRRFAAVHGGGEVVRRVEVRAVMGRDLDALDGPAFAVGKIAGRKARKEGAYHRGAFLVIDVGDPGLEAGRIGGNVALERYGNVDDAAGQGTSSLVAVSLVAISPVAVSPIAVSPVAVSPVAVVARASSIHL